MPPLTSNSVQPPVVQATESTLAYGAPSDTQTPAAPPQRAVSSQGAELFNLSQDAIVRSWQGNVGTLQGSVFETSGASYLVSGTDADNAWAVRAEGSQQYVNIPAILERDGFKAYFEGQGQEAIPEVASMRANQEQEGKQGTVFVLENGLELFVPHDQSFVSYKPPGASDFGRLDAYKDAMESGSLQFSGEPAASTAPDATSAPNVPEGTPSDEEYNAQTSDQNELATYLSLLYGEVGMEKTFTAEELKGSAEEMLARLTRLESGQVTPEDKAFFEEALNAGREDGQQITLEEAYQQQPDIFASLKVTASLLSMPEVGASGALDGQAGITVKELLQTFEADSVADSLSREDIALVAEMAAAEGAGQGEPVAEPQADEGSSVVPEEERSEV